MIPGTLKAYIVVLAFEVPGPTNVSTWLAPDAHSASALAMHQCMSGENATDANLVACVVTEMPADMLRHYLRAIEGKLPDSGNAEVLHLVPATQFDATDASTFTGRSVDDLWRKRAQGASRCAHGNLLGVPCLPCDRALADSPGSVTQVLPGATPVAEMPWAMAAAEMIRTFDWGEQFGPPAMGPPQSPLKYWGRNPRGAVWVYDEEFGPPSPSNKWTPPGVA